MAWQDRYDVVFRAKAMGKEAPRLGTPSSVQPGDFLTFFIDSAYHTREVASVHKGYIVAKPLESDYGLLDEARKVPFEDFYDAWRPKAKVAVAQPQPKVKASRAKPAPKPVSPPAPPAPEPPPATKPVKPKKQPSPGLLAFLDDAYRNQK